MKRLGVNGLALGSKNEDTVNTGIWTGNHPSIVTESEPAESHTAGWDVTLDGAHSFWYENPILSHVSCNRGPSSSMCWNALLATLFKRCRMPSCPKSPPEEPERQVSPRSHQRESRPGGQRDCDVPPISPTGGYPGGVEQTGQPVRCTTVDHHTGNPGWALASGSAQLCPLQSESTAVPVCMNIRGGIGSHLWQATVKGSLASHIAPVSPVTPLQLGFFKRSLPYGTAMEKAHLKPQAASEAWGRRLWQTATELSRGNSRGSDVSHQTLKTNLGSRGESVRLTVRRKGCRFIEEGHLNTPCSILKKKRKTNLFFWDGIWRLIFTQLIEQNNVNVMGFIP